MKSDHEALMDERVQSAKLCNDNALLRDSWCKLQQDYQNLSNDHDTLKAKLAEVEAQRDQAFISGLKRAVEIVSLRIATPKNEAFTAAIEEAKVFLGAEIERGGKPAYCVCTTHPPSTRKEQ